MSDPHQPSDAQPSRGKDDYKIFIRSQRKPKFKSLITIPMTFSAPETSCKSVVEATSNGDYETDRLAEGAGSVSEVQSSDVNPADALEIDAASSLVPNILGAHSDRPAGESIDKRESSPIPWETNQSHDNRPLNDKDVEELGKLLESYRLDKENEMDSGNSSPSATDLFSDTGSPGTVVEDRDSGMDLLLTSIVQISNQADRPNTVNDTETLENDDGNKAIDNTAEPGDDTKSSTPKASVLRDYQEALFQCAKERNTIAYLPTGSGKTLIAIKLMNFFRDTVKNGKRIFFLANTIPLLKQQAEYISKCTNYKVQIVHGGNRNQWKHWEGAIASSEVFVIIPAILLELMEHGFITFNTISLLVIDECHNALKAHHVSLLLQKYRKIMKTEPDKKLPRILGLSATIIKKTVRGNLDDAIKGVEELLCSKAVTFEEYEKVLLYSTKAEVVFRFYETDYIENGSSDCQILFEKTLEIFQNKANSINSQIAPPTTEAMMIELRRIKQDKKEYQSIIRAIDDIRTVYYELGVYGAMMAANIKYQYFKTAVFKVVKPHLRLYLLTSLRRFIFYCYTIASNQICDLTFTEVGVSNKVSKLLNILGDFRENVDDLCGIVFVKRRTEAHCLASILENLSLSFPDKWGFIRCAVVVGTNYCSGQCEGTQYRQKLSQQSEILEAFRSGDVNVIIATSILEEGLDVQSCNFVVRFDPIVSYPSFIQSMGRARNHKAKYFVLLPEEKASIDQARIVHFKYLQGRITESLQHQMRIVKDAIDIEPLDEKEEAFEDEKRLNQLEAMAFRPGCTLESPVITMHAAISLINRYCDVLKQRNLTLISKDSKIITVPLNFEKRVDQRRGEPDLDKDLYQGYVKLPAYSPVHEIVTGPSMIGKENAKRAAFLEACKKLYEKGVFDKNLLPTLSATKK